MESHCILEVCMNKEVSKVIVYLDDILITGASEEEQLQNRNNVVHQLQSSGLQLKEKYKCMVPSITFVGYRIDFEVSECAFVCELVSCKCLCVYKMCKYKYSTLKCLLQLV